MDRFDKRILFLDPPFSLFKAISERLAPPFQLPQAFLAFLVQSVKVEHIRHLQAGNTGQNEGDACDNVKQHAVNRDAAIVGNGCIKLSRKPRLYS